MEIEFADDDLDELETNPRATGGLPQGAIRGFRKVMQFLRSAVDERDLYAQKSLRFEKLEGKRKGQRSLRCNDQFRLIVELIDQGRGRKKKIRIIEIVDYH